MYASKQLHNCIMSCLPSAPAPSEDSNLAELPAELAEAEISEEDRLTWKAQDELITHLPTALKDGFSKVQKDFFEHQKVQRKISSGRFM